MRAMETVVKIHAADNVVVAVTPIAKGEAVQAAGTAITAKDAIPAGHKMAIRPIKAGEAVVKYGFPIGNATKDVTAGTWMHVHNVKSRLGNILDYSYEPEKARRPELPKKKGYTFEGYARKDGKVGIRNEVWIVPTVGCVNSIAVEIERRAQKFKTGTIDGICAYTHPYGCSQLGDDMRYTQAYLAGLIHHPNAGAVLVLALGCENNQLDLMKKAIGDYDADRVKFLTCQEVGDEIEEGVRIVRGLCAFAGQFKRTTQPAGKLVLGLKCGGSDGFSGLTANPLVGAVSNQLIAEGGTSILTEVPEMFGAETLLMNRCKDRATFEKTVQLINGFKEYFMRYGEKIHENPSPGNKEGGITTLEDKSLGCVQKGGTAIVQDVLSYGTPAVEKGLLLLQAPGNDLVAANALAASGAHIVLFTTGRGTPFACPVPTIKIASNSRLSADKKNWIDFNAGGLLEGKSMQQLCDAFFAFLMQVASGKRHAKSEVLDKHELAIFKDGVTL